MYIVSCVYNALSRGARRIRQMERRLLEWAFVVVVGSIFVELLRIISGTQIRSAEWIGIIIFVGLAVWFWREGKRMDNMDNDDKKKQWNELVEAVKVALKEDREEHRDKRG